MGKKMKCIVCGKEIGVFARTKLWDGQYACPQCLLKAGINDADTAKRINTRQLLDLYARAMLQEERGANAFYHQLALLARSECDDWFLKAYKEEIDTLMADAAFVEAVDRAHGMGEENEFRSVDALKEARENARAVLVELLDDPRFPAATKIKEGCRRKSLPDASAAQRIYFAIRALQLDRQGALPAAEADEKK